jgi:aspartyl-tRNA(Asn)/glutamyl-tRNA(Gln) amidotransferase subunit C
LSVEEPKIAKKSVGFSPPLRWKCINGGVFEQGESVVASRSSFARILSMSVTASDVAQVALLARLTIPDDRIDEVTDRFTRVLDLVAELQQVDTDGVLPMSNPHDMEQRLRSDEVTEVNERDHLQQPAPAVEDGYFLVPKVID